MLEATGFDFACSGLLSFCMFGFMCKSNEKPQKAKRQTKFQFE